MGVFLLAFIWRDTVIDANANSKNIYVVLAVAGRDDAQALRRAILTAANEMMIIVMPGTLQELERICTIQHGRNPDVVLIDQLLPHGQRNMSLPRVLRRIRQAWVNAQIVLFTPSLGESVRLFKYKVTALITPADQADIVVRKAAQLRVTLTKELADLIAKYFPNECSNLPQMERQLLMRIRHGDAPDQIATDLNLAHPSLIEKRAYNLITRLWEPFKI